MQEEYQKKLSDYQQKQATMTDAIRQISEEEIMSLQQRIQTTYQTAQQDVQKQERELLVPIQSKMVKAIQEVGAANGYTYIFDTAATLYVGADAVNLMSEVKKALGIQ
jgi:outer membrane protein